MCCKRDACSRVGLSGLLSLVEAGALRDCGIAKLEEQEWQNKGSKPLLHKIFLTFVCMNSERKLGKIRIFKSFKEQEDEMISYWASITPMQRLAHLYEMIQISFRLPQAGEHIATTGKVIKILRYEP